jgi:signal transduction histidine kinase/CheY-like chemotaxis protein
LSADDFIQFMSQALYVLLFAVVAARAVRRPLRANVDVALLFGATALLVTIGWVSQALRLPSDPLVGAFSGALIMAVPYLLLRLLDDFATVPRLVWRGAEAGLVFSVVVLFALPSPLPPLLTLLLVAYFVALAGYVAQAFVREARRTTGVTRSRMQAVALGTAFLGLTILAAGFIAALPDQAPLWTIVSHLSGLASGLCYFLGFAPPTWLRRTWQEPELRAFLGRAASLPRLPDTLAILQELRAGAASALGAPHASVGLWDEPAGVLRFYYESPPSDGRLDELRRKIAPLGVSIAADAVEVQPGQFLAGRVFAEQQALYFENAPREDPGNAAMYAGYGVVAVLAAPITAGERRLGVMLVYAPRAPIFADSDLELVRLLADQAAVILESRALIDEAARVRAREEAARLKDDFLSSAAHDLKTPLTTLLGQAQILERRAAQDGLAPAYLTAIERLVREARRLSRLVLELLDASRAERGQLVSHRESVDLAAEVREGCERLSSERHRCVLDAATPVLGEYDRVRVQQLLDNLIENAIKYSPDGGEIEVRVWSEDGVARLSVRDHGIGIPPDDLPRLFERYHRGSNVDDRRFSGLGLGLYICRGIVEQHGGRIWATSLPGQGTTFHVELPLGAAVPVAGGGRVSDAPILVVDDDPSILAVVAEILDFEGYSVETAEDGAAAIQAIERQRPSLVLLDMRMPVLDGWGFARTLDQRGVRLPIVVMTAAQDAQRWADEIGAAGYLAKPFEMPDLLTTVARHRTRPSLG